MQSNLKLTICLLFFFCSISVFGQVLELPDYGLPWVDVANPDAPYRISDQNGEFFADAYTIVTGEFDKPFIFVEGIDFGPEDFVNASLGLPAEEDQQGNSLRNGTFGWRAFMGLDPVNYDFIENMPLFLDEIRLHGYDIILLDFADGAGHIRNNGEILKQLIRDVNLAKVGDSKIVVAGASMGGQISRVAIREMELDGEDHCVRLYLSIDSPHNGASVPIGLQHTISLLAEVHDEAQVFMDSYLNRPATQELLIQQLNGNEQVHIDYQNYLNSIGFPEQCLNIAVSNGNHNGNPLILEQGDFFVLFECSHPLVENALNLRIYPTPGTGGLSQGIVSASAYMDTGDQLLAIWEHEIIDGTYYVPWDTPRYDEAPGGLRGSILDFVRVMDAKIPTIDDYPNNCSQSVQSTMYNPDHSFISTTSALGLDVQYLYANIKEAIIANPGILPFDDYYSPEIENESHTEITEVNVDFLLNYVLNGESLLDETLTQNDLNNGVYNLADPKHEIINSVTIFDNGQLFINADMPFDFGIQTPYNYVANSPDFETVSQPHHTVSTNECEPTTISIILGGSLNIGDAQNGKTAELIVNDGSEVNIGLGGTLIIESGSILRIKAGGVLNLNEGVLQIKNGGILIIEDNASLIQTGDEPVKLEGSNARIIMYGDMFISDNSMFSVSHQGYSSGKIQFMRWGNHVHGGPTATLELEGDDEDDVLIEIAEGAEIWTDESFGLLKIEDCKIVMNPDARIVTTKIRGLKANFVYNSIFQYNRGLFIREEGRFDFSIFSNTPIDFYGTGQVLQINNCEIENNQSQIRVHHGGYNVRFSNLSKASIWAEGHTIKSDIYKCKLVKTSVYDEGNVDLHITSSSLDESPVEKFKGTLGIACNDISNANSSITIIDAVLNASNDDEFGNNTFYRNGVDIECIDALEINLENGGNVFEGETYYVAGTIAGFCSKADNCVKYISASGNNWVPAQGNGNINNPDFANPTCNPIEARMDLWMLSDNCFGIYGTPPSGSACKVFLVDNTTICSNAECDRVIKPAKTEKRNRIVAKDILTIFPNPNMGLMTLVINEANSKEESDFKIVNSLGEKVYSNKIIGDELNIDLSHLPKGMYTLLTQYQSQVLSKKFLIQ